MSLFNFTRQEQMAILFLSAGLLIGGAVTLVKHRCPGFAPELTCENRLQILPADTIVAPETPAPVTPADTLVPGQVKVNQADMEELMRLPGIGPKMAERIMTYRGEHGRFRTLRDLRNVRGIGDKTLERLKPLIRFD